LLHQRSFASFFVGCRFSITQAVKLKSPHRGLKKTLLQFSIIMNRKLDNTELERPSIEEFRGKRKHPIVVVLDNVRSLNNVGSIFRTSDAFNVQRIVLCGITGTPPHREIQKTALGATETVAWSYNPDVLTVIQSLKAEGFLIVSVEQASQSISPQLLKKYSDEKICLVLGNEVEGVSQSVIGASDVVVEIPQEGTKHSLNVSVAAGIVLWESIKALTKD